jgi:hypothetical protein
VSISSGTIPEDNGAPENLYIQGMSGVGARIALDEAQINRWKDSLQQDNRHIGFSNIELSFLIDKDLSETKTYAPMTNLQIWMKNKGGEMTDKPYFSLWTKRWICFPNPISIGVYLCQRQH